MPRIFLRRIGSWPLIPPEIVVRHPTPGGYYEKTRVPRDYALSTCSSEGDP